MPLYLDIKHLNLISNQLERFSWKKENLAQCRCKFCGDSQKSKHKARGYFYEHKGGLMYKCHNCLICMSFAKFLNSVNTMIYREYLMEKYKGNNKVAVKPFVMPKLQEPVVEKPKIIITKDISALLPKVSGKALDYLVARQIPEQFYSDLYYAVSYRDFVDALVPEHGKEIPSDERIVIPFRDKDGLLVAVQGRALDPASEIRYMTIKTDNAPKIFGLNTYDPSLPGYVLEGPFDSMFIPNSLAAAGSNLKDVCKYIDVENTAFIFDNEPRGKDIVKQMTGIIDKGLKLFIWPESVVSKDINRWVLDGTSILEIHKTISTSIFSGLEGRFRLNQWKRI